MSHFTVLVIGANPEQQLAPYQENNMDDCPKEFLKFNDTEEENRKDWQNGKVTKVKMSDGELVCTYDKRFKNPKYTIFGDEKEYIVPEGLEQVEVPLITIYPDFERYLDDYCGCERNKDGKVGYWENPNAKWDWYKLGGRWTGFFKVKDGAVGIKGSPGLMTNPAKDGYADILTKEDIDIDFMKKDAREKESAFYDKIWEVIKDLPKPISWEVVREVKFKDDIKSARNFYNNQEAVIAVGKVDGWIDADKFFKFYTHTREEFIKEAEDSCLTTFALIKDNVWYERGTMGWWCSTSNENPQWQKDFMKMFDELPGDTLLSVYDCHI